MRTGPKPEPARGQAKTTKKMNPTTGDFASALASGCLDPKPKSGSHDSMIQSAGLEGPGICDLKAPSCLPPLCRLASFTARLQENWSSCSNDAAPTDLKK